MIKLNEALQATLPREPKALFDILLKWPGDVYSEGRGRVTKRIEIANGIYFIKIHTGIGWREIFKNLLMGKTPILGARTEYRAIQHCHNLNIPTMTVAGFATLGGSPASQRSFLITDALTETESLENICKQWPSHPPPSAFKRQLILALADTLKRFHGSGANHRDCYLCHFRLPLAQINQDSANPPLSLYVMDLHRVQLRQRVPFRWRVKDLGSLLFSAREFGLSTHDQLRFIRAYSQQPLKVALTDPLWQAAQKRCQRLTQKHA